MSPISMEDQRYLLHLARAVILDRLGQKLSHCLPVRNSAEFNEKRGCFVTLHLNGQLRGCIGTIEPIKSLLSAVQENAVLAGFQDSRFLPVTLEEMDKISIELSILTQPVLLLFQNPDDLRKQLKPGVHGVILSKGYHRATFLPQVWEQLPGIEDFLEHLCRKAGMGKTCWKEPKTSVEVYEVSAFSETDIHPKN